MGHSVSVTLKGGLGNQLFQFAAGYAFARSTGSSLSLDLDLLTRITKPTPRIFGLNPYGISNSSLAQGFVGQLPRQKRGVTAVPGKILQTLSGRQRVVEENFGSFAGFPGWKPSRFVMDGYWQSEDFFLPYAAELRTILGSPDVGPRAHEIGLAISQSVGGASIQVRRGDYVSDPGVSAKHGFANASYFRRAVEYLDSEDEVTEIFVFSDDISWCEENLDFGVPMSFVDIDEGEQSAVANLFALSMSRRLVISNSTFGWWAAWLSGLAGTSVVAPTPWFASQDRVGDQVARADWTLMDI